MTAISDEAMREALTKTRVYSVVILLAGPKRHEAQIEKIIWEHGRRNFELRAEGKLSIVCPIADGSNVCGLGIFNADSAETKRIMDADPGVKAGVFTYEIHPCRSFPGDSLPE
jgi:hypothetical protein